MRRFVVIAALMVLSGCAAQQTVIRGSRVTIPDPPARVDWLDDNKKAEPGVNYLDPPKLVKPGETCSPGKGGSVLVTPKAWLGIKYGLQEWPRWGKAVQSIIKKHNNLADDEPSKKSLWQRLWRK